MRRPPRWIWRNVDDLLVVAAAGAAVGASIVSAVVLGDWVDLAIAVVVLAGAIVLVQYARHTRARKIVDRRPWADAARRRRP